MNEGKERPGRDVDGWVIKGMKEVEGRRRDGYGEEEKAKRREGEEEKGKKKGGK